MFMMQALSEDRSCQRSVNARATHRVAEGLSAQAQERQVAQLDFSLAFQVGHPLELELAQRILGLTPESLQHVFFVNSGSESVDTVLEIAAARHRVRGEASRVRIIGRERGYHGVGPGGTSVGGMAANRKLYAPLRRGILLIFDEVISGFGRLGAPRSARFEQGKTDDYDGCTFSLD